MLLKDLLQSYHIHPEPLNIVSIVWRFCQRRVMFRPVQWSASEPIRDRQGQGELMAAKPL